MARFTMDEIKILGPPARDFMRLAGLIPEPLPLAGDGIADDTMALNKLLLDRRHVVLESGRTYCINGGNVVFPPGASLSSEHGAKILCRNPKDSHCFIRLAHGSMLRNVDIIADGPVPSGTGAMVLATNATDVCFSRVRIFGAGQNQRHIAGASHCLALWGCNDVVADQLQVKYSTGGGYGMEIIGGSDLSFRTCEFSDNSADGVKVMGSPVYFRPERIRFADCISSFNGQLILQKVGEEISQQIDVAPNTRYVLRYASQGTLKLPAAAVFPEGASVVFVEHPQSARVMIQTADAVVTTRKHFLHRFTARAGKWIYDNWTNGQGWDIAGCKLSFDRCAAVGNESCGYQVKPGPLAFNDTSDVSFDQCSASQTVIGNGFGIVTTNPTYIPFNVAYSDCVADTNAESGFAFTSGIQRGVRICNSVARSNLGAGITMQQWCRDFMISEMQLLGNGANGGWNWTMEGGHNTVAHNVLMDGVDAYAASLASDDDVTNPRFARCRGLWAMGPGMKAAHVVARGRNHKDNAHLVTYAGPGVTGALPPGNNVSVLGI